MVFYVLEKNEAESNSVAVSDSAVLKGDPNTSKRKAREISKISDYKKERERVLKTFCLLSYFLICILSRGIHIQVESEWSSNGWKITPLCLLLCNWPVK